jgi:hypothetical protein
MKSTTLSAVLLSCMLVAACDSDHPVVTTGPDVSVRLAWAATDACNARLAKDITAEQKNLFAKPTLDTAQTAWGLVTAACGTDGTGARDLMLKYVRFTILAQQAGRVLGADPAQLIVNHWNLVFPYVGYDAPGLDRVVLTANGAAKVVLGCEGSTTGTSLVAAAEFGIPQKAAMTYYQQYSTGDQRGHLFTIAPGAASCLTTNLVQTGICYEFSSFPNVKNPTSTQRFDPAVQLGICHEGATVGIPALGHGVTGKTELPPATASAYPTAAFCHGISTLPQFGGVFGPVKRLAYMAGNLFSVRKAYAAHGGLGGLGGFLSPYGPVDRQVFSATFDNLLAGSTPAQGTLPPPDVGIWDSVFATPPGSILVQSSLGNLSPNPVVLSQGGGACPTGCGGLLLRGKLKSSASNVYATNGLYTVTWQSLQNGPTVKKAPFVARSSTGEAIATLEYSQQSSTNYLKFNGNTLVTRWVRNESQKFEITIDLDAKTVSLKVNDAPAVYEAPAQNLSFTATDFATVGAEFDKIDSGIVGWDNIFVVRVPGQ